MIAPRKEVPVPRAADAAGIVSWVHFGDLHITDREKQNYRDLQVIIEEVNAHMSDSMSFVYLPGDNADHGSAEEYELVRAAMDRLLVPWYAIAGDHDVHPQSLVNFDRYLMPAAVFAFEISDYRFLALNAFEFEDPKVFDLSEDQLNRLERELAETRRRRKRAVLLLHCYPSDLGNAATRLRTLILTYKVLLVDMGHTHYNEIAHDGHAIYTATRSTGQIEEGPVGFSVTNLDRGVVSWCFKPLENWPFVMITTPSDQRLIFDPTSPDQVVRGVISIRAKALSTQAITSCKLRFAHEELAMRQLPDSRVWTTDVDTGELVDGSHLMQVVCNDAAGRTASDVIRVYLNQSGRYEEPLRRPRDQDNASGPWLERGILGTQLGPNKNGRKW
jgi:Icc protein